MLAFSINWRVLMVAAWLAFTSRIASRAIASGVIITASAKLNRSARCRFAPASSPVEIVAPDMAKFTPHR